MSKNFSLFMLFLVTFAMGTIYAQPNCDLLQAAKRNNFADVQIAINKGADVNCRNQSGQSTLMYASYYGNVDVIRLLIEKGADIHHKDNDSLTALMYATHNWYIHVTQLLLEKGAKIQEKDKNGRTALMHAMKNGHISLIRVLLENGASIQEKDNNDRTTLMHAMKNGHISLLRFLIENGANIHDPDDNGWTALMHAASNGDTSLVHFLIRKGADVNIKNRDGYKASVIAAIKGHLDLAQELNEEAIKESPIPIVRLLELSKLESPDLGNLRKQLDEANKLAVAQDIQVDYKVITYHKHKSSYANRLVYLAEVLAPAGRKFAVLRLTFKGDISWGADGRMSENRYTEFGNPTQFVPGAEWRAERDSWIWIYDDANGFTKAISDFYMYDFSNLSTQRLEASTPILAIVWDRDQYLPPEKVYVLEKRVLHLAKAILPSSFKP